MDRPAEYGGRCGTECSAGNCRPVHVSRSVPVRTGERSDHRPPPQSSPVVSVWLPVWFLIVLVQIQLGRVGRQKWTCHGAWWPDWRWRFLWSLWCPPCLLPPMPSSKNQRRERTLNRRATSSKMSTLNNWSGCWTKRTTWPSFGVGLFHFFFLLNSIPHFLTTTRWWTLEDFHRAYSFQVILITIHIGSIGAKSSQPGDSFHNIFLACCSWISSFSLRYSCTVTMATDPVDVANLNFTFPNHPASSLQGEGVFTTPSSPPPPSSLLAYTSIHPSSRCLEVRLETMKQHPLLLIERPAMNTKICPQFLTIF